MDDSLTVRREDKIMLKKFIILLTTLLLSFLMIGTVCAEETNYIRDEVSAFSSKEITEINKAAKAIEEQYHFKVYFWQQNQ